MVKHSSGMTLTAMSKMKSLGKAAKNSAMKRAQTPGDNPSDTPTFRSLVAKETEGKLTRDEQNTLRRLRREIRKHEWAKLNAEKPDPNKVSVSAYTSEVRELCQDVTCFLYPFCDHHRHLHLHHHHIYQLPSTTIFPSTNTIANEEPPHFNHHHHHRHHHRHHHHHHHRHTTTTTTTATTTSQQVSPEDEEAVEAVRRNLGDYKLKTSSNYVIPPDERVNTDKKRAQIVKLRTRIYNAKVAFNEYCAKVRAQTRRSHFRFMRKARVCV
jgi:hypothetical protein